jgi:hypothetical protein
LTLAPREVSNTRRHATVEVVFGDAGLAIDGARVEGARACDPVTAVDPDPHPAQAPVADRRWGLVACRHDRRGLGVERSEGRGVNDASALQVRLAALELADRALGA